MKNINKNNELSVYAEKEIKKQKQKNTKDLIKFAHIYFFGLSCDEYEFIERANIAKHVSEVYKFFSSIVNNFSIKVHNPSYTRHSVAEIIIPNQPFLVDTIWMEIGARGYEIQHTFHPVISVKRNSAGTVSSFNLASIAENGSKGFAEEALIHVEFDREESKQALKNLEKSIIKALNAAKKVADDFPQLTSKLTSVVTKIEGSPASFKYAEEIEFLKWLGDNNFIFLGYRHYDVTYKGKNIYLCSTKNTALGTMTLAKSSVAKPTKLEDLAPNLAHYITGAGLVTITKALSKAPIHRMADMDYVGIKEFDSSGKIIGEHRFLGLFTSKAYTVSARDIPLVRHKIAQVLELENKSGANTYNYKALINILETYPRDELFQIGVEDLHRISIGIVHLSERQKVKLFVRRSHRERIITAMIFLPRDKMNSNLRKRIMAILLNVYNGEDIEYATIYGEARLAKLFFKIRTRPPAPPEVDDLEVEKLIVAAIRSWEDNLQSALAVKYGDLAGDRIFARYRNAFKAGYKDNTSAHESLVDIEALEEMRDKKQNFSAIIYNCDGKHESFLKVFHRDERLGLSDLMPILEDLGLYVSDEHPARIKMAEGGSIWLHNFGVKPKLGGIIEDKKIIQGLTTALDYVWHGELESDSLNGLIASSGLSIRQVVILRAYVAYMQQIGLKYSTDYVRATLIKHANLARNLADYFDARFDISLSITASEKQQKKNLKIFETALSGVSVLDEDIILRQVMDIIKVTVRTNAWQRANVTDPLTFKISSSHIPELVKPHPYFEIFVYHSRVEGIHLRGGAVARGGLRWSDRPADYRTEILGLMKTQMTKNTVIVPVGAKGGFVIKRPPCDLKDMGSCDRDSLMNEVKSRYSVFVRSLLGITDNIIDGEVIPPRNVRRYDNDDPYLVVAADKGTATFSDTANAIAENCNDIWDKPNNGFWLGDAFASGGSVGYDHKKMAITARGAWECVKHHFRSLGTDIQKEDFTCVGIGDMAGDVFGNGMLLSKHICLQAAFNHMHIFIDPKPDSAKSWKERKRLFDLPHSGWGDYNTKLISKGGGVYSRHDKEIKLSNITKEMLGLKGNKHTPRDIMTAILHMKVDLFWNGGIGTFVKSEDENHLDVGDRANDAIRINAEDVGAKVIGEGGNLGFTQLARIEYAINGGIINTDAIDNSAGVDCSDHEVNIKILMNTVMSKKKLTLKKRNSLLEDMTDDVAQMVLKDNYLQTQILTIAEEISRGSIDTHFRLTYHLERKGLLDPAIEFLPDDEEFDRRQKLGLGLTRPELSVLMAYAKQDMFNTLINSNLPDDKGVENYLFEYFPKRLQAPYKAEINEHRLKREIITTAITNELINRMGLTFIDRMLHETGHRADSSARAFIIAKKLVKADELWELIEKLDNKIPASTQVEMLGAVKTLLEYTGAWLLRHGKHPLSINDNLKLYSPYVDAISVSLHKHLTSDMKQRYNERYNDWKKKGLNDTLSRRFALLPTLGWVMDISSIAISTGQNVEDIMALHFLVGDRLHMGFLHRQTKLIPVKNNWQRVASLTIMDALYSRQKEVTCQIVCTKNNTLKPKELLQSWITKRGEIFNLYDQLLEEVYDHDDETSYAQLNVVLGQLKGLVG